MELKEFVKTVLSDLVTAVDQASEESVRTIGLSSTQETRTVEFDIAVTVEDMTNAKGKGGIKVLQFIDVSGGIEGSTKNSTVSRIQFGVSVNSRTKEQVSKDHQIVMNRNKMPEKF